MARLDQEEYLKRISRLNRGKRWSLKSLLVVNFEDLDGNPHTVKISENETLREAMLKYQTEEWFLKQVRNRLPEQTHVDFELVLDEETLNIQLHTMKNISSSLVFGLLRIKCQAGEEEI